MKKVAFVVALALTLALWLSGPAPAGTVLDRLLKKGELVVGTTGTQPPLIMTTKGGEIIGLDADIAKLIAAGLGLKIRFSKMSFSELIPALESGKVDMIISGMTMTSERNAKVPFIGPYYVSGKGILCKEKSLASLDKEGLDSPKFKVAALKGSTSQVFVETVTPQAKLVAVASYDEALDLLYQDKIDVLVADFPFCMYCVSRYADKGLAVRGGRLTFEPLGIGIREDALLLNWLENFLKILSGTGDLSKLHDIWLKDSSWIKQLP
jgi:polar amino acid transport system substrate-binding protein